MAFAADLVNFFGVEGLNLRKLIGGSLLFHPQC